MDLTRPFQNDSANPKDKAKGIPFWPGGISKDTSENFTDTSIDPNDSYLDGINWSEMWEDILNDSNLGTTHNSINSIQNSKNLDSMIQRYEEKDAEIESYYENDFADSSPNLGAQDDSNSKPQDNQQDQLDEGFELKYSSLDKIIESSDKKFLQDSSSLNKEWAIEVDLSNGGKNFDLEIENPVMEFGFELDPFQKEAVWCLERNQSVFVSAHTSAGKTVVAEYAIALSKSHMTKTIYTSPIKALSNQKYRDFCKRFGDDHVGIVTGDVQIRPEAPCVVMTTEVLRSMLYRGSDMIRDVEFVVFDEVHYVNDVERGVVWEEVLIMLPEHVTLVLLSATVPNTKEFSEWIGRTRKTKIYVISTYKRPVPLEHYLYVPNSIASNNKDSQLLQKGFFKIVNSNGEFDSVAYRNALSEFNRKEESKSEISLKKKLKNSTNDKNQDDSKNKFKQKTNKASNDASIKMAISSERKGAKTNFQSSRGGYMWVQLISHLKSLDLLPSVFFVFSRKKCEEYCYSLRNQDFLTSKQKSQVHLFIKSALTRLNEHDMKLPQIRIVTSFLMRGIGSHHSGLLPILKEIVELLFANNFIKVLFATETFAMGVNMPAKSVVFTTVRKNDGRDFRDLNSGEYTQMSGRAGRRGLDKTGTVIIAPHNNKIYDSGTLSTMILGFPDKLQSQFKLSYSMILNLLRAKQIKVEEMIKNSFIENESMKNMPAQQKILDSVKLELENCTSVNCVICKTDLDIFYKASLELARVNFSIYKIYYQGISKGMRTNTTKKSFSKINPFVNGRLLVVNFSISSSFLAFYNTNELHTSNGITLDGDVSRFDLMWVPIYMLVEKSNVEALKDFVNTLNQINFDNSFNTLNKNVPPPVPITEDLSEFIRKQSKLLISSTSLELVSLFIPISLVVEITSFVSKNIPSNISNFIQSISEFASSDLNEKTAKYMIHKSANQIDLSILLKNRTLLQKNISNFECLICPDFQHHFYSTHFKFALEKNLNSLIYDLSGNNLELIPEYQSRLSVLERFGYIDEHKNVTLKGRVACQISTSDEIILTEMILNNSLSKYNEFEIAAILSAFVCQVKQPYKEPLASQNSEQEEDLDYPVAITEAEETIRNLVQKLVDVQNEFGITCDADEYFNSNFKFTLAHLVYKWAQGTSFYLLSETAGDIQEGVIVRTILRLNENILEVTNATKTIGNYELGEKLKTASSLIKRDIVFAASLYY
ncbi:Antiviral helicase SKI2 [Smittium culicis]|uniref:Antiviral helicase SKI2 n=1 Tax=Smittium culicis TaxID=133412 RepID=A0A1R1X0W0_9FUNG|nr:Antiviral helicase SKI2 [Smittium culicis]